MVVILVASLLVHLPSLLRPELLYDDFQLLGDCFTWGRTFEQLWLPMNEHAWPLTRLLVCLLGQLSGGMAGFAFLTALSSRVIHLATILLVFRFVRGERGVYVGLLAMAVFGISSSYQQAISWFAASPGMWCLATGVLALLAVQRWRNGGNWTSLVWAFAFTLLAPAWYAGGVIFGPVCAGYLFGRGERGKWWAWLIPLLGTVAYLAISLPLAGDRILHAEHHAGRTTIQAYDGTAAVVNTARSLVDCLALGSVGVAGFACPVWVSVPGALALIGLLVWWCRQAADLRLILLGVLLILFNDLLIYGARAAWSYDRQLVLWSRYHLFPQLGLVLILVGGWRRPADLTVTTRLPPMQTERLLWFVLVLFVLQSPRGWIGSPVTTAEQHAALRAVDEVDAVCRTRRISAADARTVLPPRAMPHGDCDVWQFLRGSDRPSPVTDDGRAAILRAASR